MQFSFTPAVRKQRKARIGLVGPSGSGKTYTALQIATGFGGRIAVIDTENHSSSLYAGTFRFDVLDLDTFSPLTYVQAIKAAEQAGYDVLVIDSLSHAWMGKDGALEQVDKAAARSRSGNTFAAWREVTPMHNELVETIIRADMHVIVTMRAKTEYIIEQVTRNGKTVHEPRKVGMAPVQRDGLEYEFDVVADMDWDNRFIVSKTRAPFLAGAVIQRPGPELGEQILAWLMEGEKAPAPQSPPAPGPQAPTPTASTANGRQNGSQAQQRTVEQALTAYFAATGEKGFEPEDAKRLLALTAWKQTGVYPESSKDVPVSLVDALAARVRRADPDQIAQGWQALADEYEAAQQGVAP